MAVQPSISQGTTLGGLSCCVADFSFPIQRNYFETSHAKGEQDAAGSHVKQQASLAVIRGRANITNAKQLCDHLTANFSKPAQSFFPSCSTAVSLKRRLFFYVPADGEEVVPRHREGRRFNTIKGIRKLHSVVTSSRQLKVLVRQHSCYCGECLYTNYPGCKNKEYVDDFREVELERKASAAVTRSRADETPEAQPVHLHVADLVSKDSIIAIAAEEDASYDYYLLKMTTDGVVVLTKDETDDYGSLFQAGNAVV